MTEETTQLDDQQFIKECLETRRELCRLQPSSLRIINDYTLVEDFVILYDQLLDRVATSCGINIYDPNNEPELRF